MTRGYQDWRIPNAAVAVSIVVATGAAAFDIIPAPGVGFRIALYGLWMESDAAVITVGVLEEQTAGGGAVRSLGRLALPGAGITPPIAFYGLPFGENNKLRQNTGAPGGTIRISALYTIETV